MANQSQLLTEFYRAYRDWSLNPDSDTMLPNYGLCQNLYHYCTNCGADSRALNKELREQFQDAGLDTVYPFNGGDEDTYNNECDHERTLMNVQRLLWVNEHCKG